MALPLSVKRQNGIKIPDENLKNMFFFQELLVGNIMYKNIPKVKTSKSDTIKINNCFKVKRSLTN